jgi:hypothetical protein
MTGARQTPRSVDDGIKPAAWRQMTDEQKARNEARAADLASRADEMNSLSEQVSDAFAKTAGATEDLEAASAFKKFTGPVGKLLSTIAAAEGFKADRHRGMPLDEAVIKHGGGLVLGTLIGDVAGAAGATVCAPADPVAGPIPSIFCGGAMKHMGGKDGEWLAEAGADAWHASKASVGSLVNTFRRNVGAINTPSNWAPGQDR